MASRVLVVEPHALLRKGIRASVRSTAQVHNCADFPAARPQLFSGTWDWLVTNVRLGAFNGLHLVYLAAANGLRIRSVVYGEAGDLTLAREAQRIGAFFQYRDQLLHALPALLGGPLPPADRRDPVARERRYLFRGGRRAIDGHISGAVAN